MRHFAVLALILLCSAPAGCPVRTGGPDPPLPVLQSALLRAEGIREPSGIAYHADRGTLFVADDGGTLGEMRLDGRVIRTRRVRQADIEGVAVDPGTGMLYLAVEGDDAVLLVDPESLDVLAEYVLPRSDGGITLLGEGGNGVEAIAVVGPGRLFVANQDDPPVVVEVDLPGDGSAPRILSHFRPEATDLSALYWDDHRQVLMLVSDSGNRLMAYSRTGELRASWTLPGRDQEGLAVAPDGTTYVAQDSGGVLRLEVDWLRAFGSVARPDTLDGGG